MTGNFIFSQIENYLCIETGEGDTPNTFWRDINGTGVGCDTIEFAQVTSCRIAIGIQRSQNQNNRHETKNFHFMCLTFGCVIRKHPLPRGCSSVG